MIIINTGCSKIAKDTSQEIISASNLWHEDCPKNEREQRIIDVGEVSLNVACRGSGPTIVFLHGFPEFHYSWDKVMNELSSDFRLIAPDQRGYNLSDKPSDVEEYILPNLAQDIKNLLHLISSEPVILVAHDWGGPVGWLVAHDSSSHIRAFLSTNGPHPLRFAQLLAEDPAQQEASSYMDFFRQPASEEFFTEITLEGMFADILSEEDMYIYKEAWFQEGAITGGLNWYRANDLTVEHTEILFEDLSPTVNVPTIVMWGMEDDAVLPSNAEGLEEYVSELEIQKYEGVDHWIEHRIPNKIADAIKKLDIQAQ